MEKLKYVLSILSILELDIGYISVYIDMNIDNIFFSIKYVF